MSPLTERWTGKNWRICWHRLRPNKLEYFQQFLKFVADVDGLDVEKEGPVIRWDKAFQPEGANANFVEVAADGLHVRTFEKGVEGETLACGTGLTASAIAAYAAGHAGVIPGSTGNLFRLQCRRGDWLQVDFKAHGDRFTDVYLTGPAELIAYKTR